LPNNFALQGGAGMSFDLKIVNGDLVVNQGDLQKVEDSEKLIQDILKICLTDVGGNPIHPSYGSFLSRSVIGNPQQTSVVVQIAKSQLNSCLTNLQYLQTLQVKSQQKMTADEQLAAITGISVLRSAFDPRLFNVKISCVTKGFKPITTAFSISTI
jgi:phage baseplate assembly protein W